VSEEPVPTIYEWAGGKVVEHAPGLGRAAVSAIRRAALLLAIVIALTGCGGSAGENLPGAVEAFERRLESSRGVLHVVTDELRVVSERYAPDLPPAGWSDEVWLDLGGRGWRAHRTSRDGGAMQVADERGIRTYTRFGFTGYDREDPDYLMRPWRASAVIDPVRLVREGRLTLVGGARVRDRPAYLVVVEPDPALNTRLYIARDDGDLLRVTHRAERFGRLRMIVQDYLLFEIVGQGPRSLDDLLARGGTGR
jgi:hypothetical protein